MSTGRAIGVGLATALGFVLGVYVGVYLIMATVDFGRPFETRFVLATLGPGTLLALLAGIAAAPHRSNAWTPMTVAGLAVGVLSITVLILIDDGDPAWFIPIGLLLVAAVTTTAYRSAS